MYSILLTSAVLLLKSFTTVFAPAASSPFGDTYWQISAVTVTPAMDIRQNGKLETNLFLLIEKCAQDDAFLYKSDGSVHTNRGKLKCDEDEEQEEETGSWTYNAATKTLTQKNFDSRKNIEAQLKEKTSNKLVFLSIVKTSKGSHQITTVYVVKS